MNMNLVHMPVCCKALWTCIERDELPYDPTYRSVCFYFKREDYYVKNYNEPEFQQYFLKYCPFCGTKMPKHFYASDIYDNALEEAVGKECCDITDDEIPEEFKTDEWWIKRGYGNKELIDDVDLMNKQIEDQLYVYPTSRDADAFIEELKNLGVLENKEGSDDEQ